MDNFIDGKFQKPMQGEVASEIDVAVAVRAAHKALKAWSEAENRIALLQQVAERLKVDGAEYFASAAKSEGCAIGVCGIVASYETPFLCRALAGALSCGNTVVVKPSSKNFSEAVELASALEVLPAGVCNIIFGPGEPVGSYLVQHPGVPMISFTGTQATAQKVLGLAAPWLKRVHLDLGGKNAAIVLADADLAEAVPRLVEACFTNGGQGAHSVSKILVQESRLKEFTEAFVNKVSKLAPAVIHRPKRAEEFLALARQENGRILCGGQSGKEGFQPTVIEELTNCSELHQTELLAPIVTLAGFKYPFDAVKLVNTSPYGLSASVWGKSVSAKILAGLEVGTVWVNTWNKFDPRAPYGGLKGSGSGVRTVTEIYSNCQLVVS